VIETSGEKANGNGKQRAPKSGPPVKRKRKATKAPEPPANPSDQTMTG